jgi:hypothetical protein
MNARLLAITLIVMALAGSVAVAGCGGGGDGESETGGATATEAAVTPTTPAVVAKADRICRQIAHELRAIGHRAAHSSATNGLELTTEGMIRPTIPVLAHAGRRLEALKPAAGNPSYDLFVDLFDPALVLAEKRLAAGRRGDHPSSQGLEEQLTNLGETQRGAARDAGLDDCDVDFQRILASSLNG